MNEINVKEVIRKEVRQAWETLKIMIKLYGDDDKVTAKYRGQWAALDYLWNELYPNDKY